MLAGGLGVLVGGMPGCMQRSGARGQLPCPAPGMPQECGPRRPRWLAAIFPTQEHFLP